VRQDGKKHVLEQPKSNHVKKNFAGEETLGAGTKTPRASGE